MPRLRRDETVRDEFMRRFQEEIGRRPTQEEYSMNLSHAFLAEHVKIGEKIVEFTKDGSIPNFKSANTIEELTAMVQIFKRAVVTLVLYIINADEQYVERLSRGTDYKSLVDAINSFYKNDKASMNSENFKISGTNWDSIGYDYDAFAKGKNATKYLILSLQRVEKALSKIDKPKGFFIRKALSFDDVKKEMDEFADKLKNEKKPLMKYSKALLHVAGLKTEKELARDEPRMRAAQADAAVREESSSDSNSSLADYQGEIREEEETIEPLLSQQEPEGTATSASAVDAPPRSPRLLEGEEEKQERRSSSGSRPRSRFT